MIFLDSTYIIGLLIDNDSYTNQSLLIKPMIKDEIKIINNTVFNEVLNSLTANNSKYNFNTIIKLLLSYDINVLTLNDYKASTKIYRHYNHAINFSDCTILKTMQDNYINTIVSFDSDFDKIKGINRICI